MKTITFSDQLAIFACCTCDMTFAVTKSFEQRRRNDHGTFHCPAGHPQVFSGPTDSQRERARAEELERRLASAQEDVRVARMQRETEKRSHAATKGQLTKTRQRADRGVCQHCQRSFVNVARHVATKHPQACE